MDRASSNEVSATMAQPEGRVPRGPRYSVRLKPSGQAQVQPTISTSFRGQASSSVGQGQQEQKPSSTVTAMVSHNSTPPPPTNKNTPIDLSALEPTKASSGIRPPPKSHHRLTRDHTLPAIPPLPPPHDYDIKKEEPDDAVDHDSLDSDDLEKYHDKPLPPTKLPPTRQKTFLVGFMSRHPWIRQHRRRFVAYVFFGIFLFLTLVILLAVFLSRKGNEDDGAGRGGQGGGEGGGNIGPNDEYHTGLKDTKKLEDLRKFNKGKKPPPVNTAVSSGWTDHGTGEGTYYNPAERTPFGFQLGACEFEYVNSPKDMIAALNIVDFQAQLYPRKRDSPACGQCLNIQGPSGSVIVQVVDVCPSCKSGDIDLAPGAFAKIAQFAQGRVGITWSRCSSEQASSLNVVG